MDDCELDDMPADIWEAAEALMKERDAHPGIWSVKETVALAIRAERERAGTITASRAKTQAADSTAS